MLSQKLSIADILVIQTLSFSQSEIQEFFMTSVKEYIFPVNQSVCIDLTLNT